MRMIMMLIALATLCACATDDTMSKRQSGQHMVCHKGHTQAVTSGDFLKHLDHGDTAGPCPKDQ